MCFCAGQNEYEYFSAQTASRDDASAGVDCHPGQIAVRCECANSQCDGAHFIGDTCKVFHSGHSGSSQVGCEVLLFLYPNTPLKGPCAFIRYKRTNPSNRTNYKSFDVG